MTLKIKVLPAYNGDSFLISFGEKELSTLMIDTGTRRFYSKGILKAELERHKIIDLLILTHIDEDHIGGIIKYFEDSERKQRIFKKVIFNSAKIIEKDLTFLDFVSKDILLRDPKQLKMSIKQGITLEGELQREKILHNKTVVAGDIFDIKGARITFLSPEINDLETLYDKWQIEKESQLEMSCKNDYDDSIASLSVKPFIETGSYQNKSSLAFLFEYNAKSILFMGDAFSSVVEKNLSVVKRRANKIKVDIVKLSHHGSKYGSSYDLLNKIDCNKYIISTNGKFGLPNKETLARIINLNKTAIDFYFNYSNDILKSIFSLNELNNGSFNVHYLDNETDNYTIDLSE